MGSAYNRVIETRKELTKQLLAEMEQGELPWMKGWKTTGTRPYNPVTKAVYMDLCQYIGHKKLNFFMRLR